MPGAREGVAFGQIKAFAIDQPLITVVTTRTKGKNPPIGKKKPPVPRLPPFPKNTITGNFVLAAEVPVEVCDIKPQFTFGSLIEAEAVLRPNLPDLHALDVSRTTGRRQLLVHVEHGSEIDFDDLQFLAPLAEKGIDVMLGILPKTKR